jgi:hypothetical protein
MFIIAFKIVKNIIINECILKIRISKRLHKVLVATKLKQKLSKIKI